MELSRCISQTKKNNVASITEEGPVNLTSAPYIPEIILLILSPFTPHMPDQWFWDYESYIIEARHGILGGYI